MLRTHTKGEAAAMELGEIVRVSNQVDVARVNRMLDAGWVLLGVATGKDEERGDEPMIIYSLGATSETAEEG
jgi:hypothetical protein